MSAMLIYTVRRMLAAIPVMLAASIFVFLLVSLAGDPLQGLRLAEPPVSESTIAAMENRLYLDHSVPGRYWIWLTGIGGDGCSVLPWFSESCNVGLLRGNFGPSMREAIDIKSALGDRVLITLRLVLLATLLSIVLGMVTGVISAVRQYSKLDHFLTFFGFFALAMPIFFIAALIKEGGLFVNDVFGRTVLFTIGAASADTRGYTTWEAFTDTMGHMVLPTVTLMLGGYAVISRFQRASMLEVLNSDYVRLARAKGLRNKVVMRRHALRTALIPVMVLAVPAVVVVADGAVLTETVFQWNGMGRLFLQAVASRDMFMIMGALMLIGILIVIANLIADLLLAVLDPRIRYE
jgi:peptide/nickel transport system permease protein